VTTPLVTVVVTVYQRLDFLAEALRSVAAQTFRDFEVIVADDSGSGAASGITAAFTSDERFRYLDNGETLGVSLSLRRALGAARGTYVAILNDDDLWEPQFLSRLVPVLEADRRRVLAFADHWVMTEGGEVDREASDRTTEKYGRRDLPEGDVPDPPRFVLQKNGVPLAMAALFRASALDLRRLVPEVAGAYDWWISVLLAASRGRFYYVPDRLTRYRVHSRMETARRSPDKGECTVFILRALMAEDCFPELRHQLRARLARSTVSVGRDCLYFDQSSKARELFMSAFRLSPGWRPLAAYGLSVLPRPMRKAFGVSRA
jgi:glycosyltransferase involved in cell wall biosynthesis